MERKKPYRPYSDSLYFAVGAFARAIENLADECWRSTGLSAAEAGLMMHLVGDAAAFPFAISDKLRVNPSTVTRLADKLVAKGLIRRIEEGKLTFLELTPNGKQLAPEVIQGKHDLFERCDQIFAKDRSRPMTASLFRIADDIKDHLTTQHICSQREK